MSFVLEIQMRYFGMIFKHCDLFEDAFLFQLLIFFLTVVFIVLTVAFTQEVQGVKTTLPYIASTFAFYLTTDALFIELFSQWPILSKIEKFECREALYGRLCLKIAASIMAAAIQITLLV